MNPYWILVAGMYLWLFFGGNVGDFVESHLGDQSTPFSFTEMMETGRKTLAVIALGLFVAALCLFVIGVLENLGVPRVPAG